MLNPSKLCVEGIYILLGEPDNTLDIPQLNETQALVTICCEECNTQRATCHTEQWHVLEPTLL